PTGPQRRTSSTQTLTRVSEGVNAGGAGRRSERELSAVVVGRQLDARDAELSLLRQHREHGGHGPFGQPQLAGKLARAHRAEPLQARANVVIDFVPPAVHLPLLRCSGLRHLRRLNVDSQAVKSFPYGRVERENTRSAKDGVFLASGQRA